MSFNEFQAGENPEGPHFYVLCWGQQYTWERAIVLGLRDVAGTWRDSTQRQLMDLGPRSWSESPAVHLLPPTSKASTCLTEEQTRTPSASCPTAHGPLGAEPGPESALCARPPALGAHKHHLALPGAQGQLVTFPLDTRGRCGSAHSTSPPGLPWGRPGLPGVWCLLQCVIIITPSRLHLPDRPLQHKD